jgi:transposase-like protein
VLIVVLRRLRHKLSLRDLAKMFLVRGIAVLQYLRMAASRHATTLKKAWLKHVERNRGDCVL